jgi:SAM-dependent methyltransferase
VTSAGGRKKPNAGWSAWRPCRPHIEEEVDVHPTAIKNAELFFQSYAPQLASGRVVEIGAQDVNGSIRTVCPTRFEYIGVDFCAAKGVDIVITDPYQLPFEDGSVDVVISSSCFEHSEFFWLVFMEVMRCLKPHGLFYLNVPSAGEFHRYPVDCWRFYPDSGMALVNWGRRNGLKPGLLESYIQVGGQWQDYIAVFIKDEGFATNYTARILDKKSDYENGLVHGGAEFRNPFALTQYERQMLAIRGIADGTIVVK